MKIRTILTLVMIAIVLAVISLWIGQQAYSWLPPQASAEAQLIDRLFSFLVTLGSFIFLGVAGALTYSIVFQQAGKYDFSDGPHVEGNVPLEIVWTVIPFVLVIWIAGYSYQIYEQMAILGPMEHTHQTTAIAQRASTATGATDMQEQQSTTAIEVYARQWAWEFRYPEQNVTSTELHLPSHQRIKLSLHSEDVLHGFFVPAFRVKQDVIPGRVIDFSFTPIREGQYRLRDSQYSGTYFAAMQADVVVESPDAYQQWLTVSATHPPIAASNQAFDEYHRGQNPLNTGWKTVEPAPPPVVNAPSGQARNL
ncbi:MAG: cytochrome c oxidase subunit II [Scytolyngbya sp. HA4215-MV1]|jgi:cytochrome c oxidase subunit 2|nr:cytochrome c oxidase subunit II [Scytolyngbya sp. HA4215-MV1]